MDMRASRRVLLRGGAVASIAALAGCSDEEPSADAPSASPSPTAATSGPSSDGTSATTSPSPDRTAPELVVDGLAVPWGIVFLPDGSALVGERDTGRLLHVTDGNADEVGTLDVRSRVDEGGETGLLGLALHPQFQGNRLLYAFISTDDDNRVIRMTYDGRLGVPDAVLTGMDTSVHHNGGALAFGPDHLLYVATGDAEDSANAQDKGSLGGKVLRMTDGGEPAKGNPFDNLTWSYGHRNVEGLAFDDRGFLWASEFGDKGADELNLIRPGKNYGWPDVEGSDGSGGFADPLAEWPVDQCSPSGIAIASGRAWLGALRGESVWSVVLDGEDRGKTERLLEGDYGRLRMVAHAPDGSLWIGTSNRDGRTDPRPGDDRILRVTM